MHRKDDSDYVPHALCVCIRLHIRQGPSAYTDLGTDAVCVCVCCTLTDNIIPFIGTVRNA